MYLPTKVTYIWNTYGYRLEHVFKKQPLANLDAKANFITDVLAIRWRYQNVYKVQNKIRITEKQSKDLNDAAKVQEFCSKY